MLVVCCRRDRWLIHPRGVMHHEKSDTSIDQRAEQGNAYRTFDSLDSSLSPFGLLSLVSSNDCFGLGLLGFALDSSRFILKNAVNGTFVTRTFVPFVGAFCTPPRSLITLEVVSQM